LFSNLRRTFSDSVIYLSPTGEHLLPLGDYLGDLTDELDGGYIVEFASGGPKQYGYRVMTSDGKEKTHVKIRGFTINSETAKQLNFKNLKRLVHDYVQEHTRNTIDVSMSRIMRTRDRDVVTKTMRKTYRVVYDKRFVLADFSTLPYGI
jgi:hypothetical protein